jgi:transposase InsO family protein
MCSALDVSRSGYYDWRHRGPSDREKKDARLLEAIERIWTDSRQTYGSPRIHRTLQEEGWMVGRNRVARLMREHDIRARQAQVASSKPTTTQSDHDKPVADNVLDRNFDGHEPGEVWLTDITYVETAQDRLYLAGVMDCASREIVGWAMETSMEADLVCKALEMATRRRDLKPRALHHSDRGSQYASADDQQMLDEASMETSMSRVGDCWDNAPKESFFGTLENELLAHCDFQTTEEAQDEIFEYIEVFYSRKRRHSALGGLSPAAYRVAHSS